MLAKPWWLVLHLLWVDLQPYSKAGSGVTRTCLPPGKLWVAAQAWIDFHKSSAHEKDRKALQACTAYAELWNTFKRLVLQECALHVLVAPSKRLYFAKPQARPRAPGWVRSGRESKSQQFLIKII